MHAEVVDKSYVRRPYWSNSRCRLGFGKSNAIVRFTLPQPHQQMSTSTVNSHSAHVCGIWACCFGISLNTDSLATLIYNVVNSWIDYCNTVLAGAPRTVIDKLQRAECCFTRYHRHSEVWLRPESDTASWTSLARRSWRGIFQAHSDSSSVSKRPCTTVPNRLLHPGLQRCHSEHLSSANHHLLAEMRFRFNTYSCRAFSVASPGTPFQILSRTQRSVHTVSDMLSKRICFLDTSASSAIKVLWQ